MLSVVLPNVCVLNVLTLHISPSTGLSLLRILFVCVVCTHDVTGFACGCPCLWHHTPLVDFFFPPSSSSSFHSPFSPSFSFLLPFFCISFSTYFLLSPFLPFSSSLQWREGSAGEEGTLSSQPNKACNAQSFGGGLWRPVRKGLFSLAICVVLPMVYWKWRGCEMKNV